MLKGLNQNSNVLTVNFMPEELITIFLSLPSTLYYPSNELHYDHVNVRSLIDYNLYHLLILRYMLQDFSFNLHHLFEDLWLIHLNECFKSLMSPLHQKDELSN